MILIFRGLRLGAQTKYFITVCFKIQVEELNFAKLQKLWENSTWRQSYLNFPENAQKYIGFVTKTIFSSPEHTDHSELFNIFWAPYAHPTALVPKTRVSVNTWCCRPSQWSVRLIVVFVRDLSELCSNPGREQGIFPWPRSSFVRGNQELAGRGWRRRWQIPWPTSLWSTVVGSGSPRARKVPNSRLLAT